MNITNEMSIINMNGMFQYFLILDQTNRRKLPNQRILFDLNQKENSIECSKNDKLKTKLTQKKIQFNPKITIYKMYTWQIANMQARMNIWQQAAMDRVRFKNRINNLSSIISPILEHKLKIIQTSTILEGQTD